MADLEDSPRAIRTRRLKRRHTIVLTLVLTMMMVAFLYAATYYTGWVRPTAEAAGANCHQVKVPAPRPASFRLNVYNNSDKVGLARTTSKALARRGYRIGTVANDPSQAPVRAPAEVRFGDKGYDAALMVAAMIPDTRMVHDPRRDTSVDLALGPDFRGLTKAPPAPLPAPDKVRVNVFNTTFRTGLAKSAASEVAARGFHIGKVGNDPSKVVLDVAEIRYGEDGEPAARLLARQVAGAKLVRDNRVGATVDLALGNLFTVFVPRAEAAVPPTHTPTPMVTRPGC